MKKLLFLTMIFGLLVALNGSASAQLQIKGTVNDIDGSGKLKPALGDTMSVGFVRPTLDNPALGIKKGQQYCAFAIQRGKGQQVSAFLELDCKKDTPFRNTAKITKIENPGNADILVGDKVTIVSDLKTITFTRGGKVTIKLAF